ncbi:molybdenum cofactor biosynthesis protein MoaE [Actinomadura graeca]|uniref:Molybdenum cofactor biosynthesis protein MoaE n=1 Tax=Actinomadura graeca TaxID=2750812 RepID=A0ABX8QU97_9ACTN|nr:molybdenum cofactor biosynthesis protein MoaE [Actinomadura graeca]QXJ22305.1 molybdenum cofactor biosynthesis protein MoaE [Actinomadura graeca]
MQIRVLYFGIVRERIANTREEPVTLPAGSSLRDLMGALCAAHPGLAPMSAHLRLAVNEDIAGPAHRLADGDVVALIPPVAGGADPYCRITDRPIVLDEVLGAVSGPGQGGSVVFTGYVRDNSGGKPVTELEYEAYGTMAHKTLAAIIRACEDAAPGVRVAVAHRTGRLKVGEVVVVIAASAPHRGEAFQAARDCAERLKAEVPIWKKEIGPDGEVWVEAPDLTGLGDHSGGPG